MPRPGLPPTPASSTDLPAKDNARISSFTLPPPAIKSTSSDSSNASVQSDSSYRPVSPPSPLAKRTAYKHRRPSSNQMQDPPPPKASEFSLPPPPTRSRKIIQMEPGPPSRPQLSSPSTLKGAPSGAPFTNQTPKKQPSTTSVAGKKIARKTAHSLIERRRRSKMNEEFGVLKDMIPACRDQEMHKLAILQASIDYLRYLEQCVADLKTATSGLSLPHPSHTLTPRPMSENSPSNKYDSDSADEDEDLEMRDPPSQHPAPPSQVDSRRASYTSTTTTTSPAHPFAHHGTHNSSYTSIPSLPSSLPSPVFSVHSYQCFADPQQRTHSQSQSHSTEASPALLPRAMQDADQEATAALLMLNRERRWERFGEGRGDERTDGRGKGARGAGRGMSVQDLLSA